MHLQSWNKHFSGTTYGGDAVFDPAIQLSAILTCPCCKSKQSIEAPGHQIGQRGMNSASPAERVADCIEWEIQDLSKQRPCEECGVISVIPPAEVKQLIQQVKEDVTLIWVATQEQRIIEEQKKVA